MGASLALYCAGLLWNDCFDYATDRRERPWRPLPSGRIGRARACWVAAGLSALGVLLAGHAWPWAASLLGLILFYDGVAKRFAGLGVTVMGCCRGANLLLGVLCSWPQEAQPWPPMALFAAGYMTLYILLVSVVARGEAEAGARVSRPLRVLPVAMTLLFVPLLWLRGQSEALWAPLAACVPLAVLLLVRRPVPEVVGGLIRHLVLLQALWCLLGSGETTLPAALLGCWFAAVLCGRRVAGS